jgi:hypothetical protein
MENDDISWVEMSDTGIISAIGSCKTGNAQTSLKLI